jgi:DNA-binding SARP family transcriptional activator
LCELLWDVPDDPRGALRWCLSKIRRVLDEPGRQRVRSRGDAVDFDLSDCFVDVIEILRAADEGFETLAPDRPDCLDEFAPYYDFKARCEKIAAGPPLMPANEVAARVAL